MSNYYAKDLFQSQSDLIEAKVDMAASKAIERVVNLIGDLRNDMDQRFVDVGNRLSDLKERVVAVESTVTYVRNAQDRMSTKIIDYTFQGGWLMLSSIVAYIVLRYLGIFH